MADFVARDCYMSHAEKCPVCDGTGKVQDNGPSGTSIDFKTCHGCGGKGFVVVADEKEFVPFLVLYPVYPQPNYVIYEPTFPSYPFITCSTGLRTTSGF